MSSAPIAPDLRVEASNRQILSIALPISFSIFVPQINFITNNIFLGQLGEDALAAAGITGVYYLIFGAIGFGLNNGLQAMISRRAGQDRIPEIGKIFIQGVYLSLIIALAGILITWWVAPTLLRMTLSSTEMTNRCILFLDIRILGLPFLYLYQMRNALLVGTNQSKYLVWGTLAETLANIVLDYGLIFGNLGMPRLGFNGAAIASISAEFIGMAVVFGVIELKGISRQLGLYRSMRFDTSGIKLLFIQSSPLIFQYAISIISWEFFYILVEHHGERDLAISNTMRNIFGLFGVFTWSFAATANTMVSNIIGQGLPEQVPALILRIVKISMACAVMLAVLLNIFPAELLGVFGQGDVFIQDSIPTVRVVSLALVMMSFAAVWLNAVTGTGNTRINLQIELAAIIAYIVYAYLVLEIYHLHISYGWMAEWIYWGILFMLSYLYIRSNKWKGKEI